MKTARIKLLYDGECPICRREVRWLRRADREGRIAWVDISAADFRPETYGLDQAAVQGVLHAILPDGRVARAMDAVRAAYAAVGKRRLVAPTGWPILRHVFDALYRLFARNRHRIGRWLSRRPERVDRSS